jgi:hypothetical protein
VAQTQSQRRASLAVSAWLAHHDRNPAWLVRQTKADPGTIGDFLNGNRWPKLGTQGRIEKAIGYPAGELTAIADGAEPPALKDGKASPDGTVGGDPQDAQQFVESLTGERVQGGVTNEDLLREIVRSRAESDQFRAEVVDRLDVVEIGVESLSSRVAKLEERGA